ncbi:MAG: alkaline shock response membrane anchor protein AmaP [Clostridia bacterium]|nr:alkaline shock response membrane anchor protein AmaP [Clostridia bacterium]
MKIRFGERFLAALSGLCLIVLGLLIALWGLKWLPQTWLALEGYGLIKLLVAVALILLGIFDCSLLFRRSKGRKGFVLQTTENGELSISIKAMESLVHKCVDKHEEIHVLSTSISNSRDGVVVALRISLANGVSIPLAVNSLQKQIKQYITACSGVDVHEIKVQVETTSAEAKNSPYAVPDVEIQLEKEPEVPQSSKLPMIDEPEAKAAVSEKKPDEQAGKRPLHQRLFSHREEETFVPIPPAETPETENTADAAAMEAESVSEEENADETV